MLSLTSAKHRKYLADLEAKKAEGCVASDPAGVKQRKLKRKDVTAKTDAGVGGTAMNICNVDVVGDGVAASQADSPHPKKMKTGKGVDVGQTCSSNERDGNAAGTGSVPLSTQVTESFWHNDFDFRRYETFVLNVYLSLQSFSMYLA